MRLSPIRRGLSITTLLLTIGSLLIIVGTFYTADHFAVQSVTTRRTVTPQGFTISVTFNTHNNGLYSVTLDLLGRILSAQQEVVRNSTSWTVDPGYSSNHTFTMQIDNATSATYFAPLSPQPVFDFSITGHTAYGLISVNLAGQRPINMTGG